MQPAVTTRRHRRASNDEPGGRLGVSDILTEDHLTSAERIERGGGPIACIAGALSFCEYLAGLQAAGFIAVSITPSHEVTDGMRSTIIKAIKPA
jgi:arsenite methyltransferase